MQTISLLDCTLRDGGYVNNWLFGANAIHEILEKLVSSQVEYIECGYLSQIKGGNPDSTQFINLEAVMSIVPHKKENQQYAVMINYGEYDIDSIPEAKENSPVIRVCFHQKARYDAIEYCGALVQKGYKVFVQAMAALNYSDIEFIDLIQRTNEIHPYGFYIVDSFGALELRDFQRLISISEKNLDMDIILGYHSHNNLQQAYGNAKFFVEQNLQHKIVLDASVFGIGRGAGNLNIELFSSYLNRNYSKNYNIDSFLDIQDEYLHPIFIENFWGYSLPFYLSAQYNCHPNYAIFFSEKNTLSNKSMKQLLSSLPEDVKIKYSDEMAEHYYQEFQKNLIDDSKNVNYLKQKFSNRDILILAPGKTLKIDYKMVQDYIVNNNPIIIAINVKPENFDCDYLFCSNEKRIKKINNLGRTQLIITSNLLTEVNYEAMVLNYSSLLIDNNLIVDNPTLMFINFLININKDKVSIAGFDGYSANQLENYFDPTLSLGSSIKTKLQKNNIIKSTINSFSSSIKINFITPSKYKD